MDKSRFTIINLDMYGEEFRKGYDASSVTHAMKECVLTTQETGKSCEIYVKIHEDSLSLCQGLCAENMILSKTFKKLPIESDIKLEEDETWLRLSPHPKFWK